VKTVAAAVAAKSRGLSSVRAETATVVAVVVGLRC